MAGDNSKELMQIHHAIDIKIENFSNYDECKKVSASFNHKKTSFNQIFRIEVYPNGICPKYRGRISVKISKFSTQMDLDNTCHSWMLSVVDVHGSDKCRQSFVKENIKGFSYNEVIPDFLMLTFLLNQADELLPEDVLTIRCEMIETDCTSSIEHFALQTYSNCDYPESFLQEGKESSDVKPLAESNTNYVGNYGKARIELELYKIISSTADLNLHMCGFFYMNASYHGRLKNMLAEFDAIDEVRQTYLSTHEVFCNYLITKEKCRKFLSKKPNDTCIKNFLRLVDLESSNDNETLRTTQMIPGSTHVESECFSETLDQEDLLGHKDEERGRITAFNLPFDIDNRWAFERCLTMFEYYKDEMGSVLERLQFDNDSKIMCEEDDYRKEGKTQISSGPSNDEDKCCSDVVGDCFLKLEDAESKKAIATVRPFDCSHIPSNSEPCSSTSVEPFDLEEHPSTEEPNGTLKKLKERMLYILKEQEINDNSKNVCPEKEFEMERTTQMTSEPLDDGNKQFSGIAVQQWFLTHEEGKSTTETDQSFDIERDPLYKKLKNVVLDIDETIKCLLQDQSSDNSSKNVDEGECESERTKQMTSGHSNDIGKVGHECLLDNKGREIEMTGVKDLPLDLLIERSHNNTLKHYEKMIAFLLNVEESLSKTENVCERDATFQMISGLPNIKGKCFFKIIREMFEALVVIMKDPNSFISKCDEEGERTTLDFEMAFDRENINRHLPGEESESGVDSTIENQTRWNICIETMDDITFTIPFENDKDTLGSKLVSSSEVFERMLKLPMREKLEKKVKLVDIDCGTFINFLHFLQMKDVKVEAFSELCDIYELADKYNVEELMSLCVERMQPFFSSSNIDEVENLAFLHSDEHLLESMKLFKDQILDLYRN